jgi:hypothetical protein
VLYCLQATRNINSILLALTPVQSSGRPFFSFLPFKNLDDDWFPPEATRGSEIMVQALKNDQQPTFESYASIVYT